jgi:hypothetical protein
MIPFVSPEHQNRKKYNEEEATSIAFWIEEVRCPARFGICNNAIIQVIDEDLEFPEDIMASLRTGIDLCR